VANRVIGELRVIAYSRTRGGPDDQESSAAGH
jgi:hypothetical protein